MKCTIITIYDSDTNYGNRLQNYAVQSVLSSFAENVDTISFLKRFSDEKMIIKYSLQRLSGYRLPGDFFYWKYHAPKQILFYKFNKQYINTKHITSLAMIIRLKSDYFVLGSDQVWNPIWYDDCELKKNLFLLTFATPEQKVCFSPSFGTEHLPREWTLLFKQYLSTIPLISVREEAGAKIVKDLTGKNAEVLIDPTMMLDAVDWMKIAKKPKKVDCDKPYILTYFLGGHSERMEQDMHRFACENNLIIYNLMDYMQPDVYVTGPSEFIYLISRSKLVMTDSFHACVFSFLFDKPFLVYAREGIEYKMMSRIDTFLGKFHLERKFVDSGLENNVFEADYTQGYEQLEIERKKVINFLKRSMKLS